MTPTPWYRQLHWQILLGLGLGLLYGLLASSLGWADFTRLWIKPWGTIFINLLKMVAVPLVLASLITGVASLSDVSRLSRIGGKTIAIYVATTAAAVTIGLGVVNLFKPGRALPPEVSRELQAEYRGEVEKLAKTAAQVQESGPLQPVVDIVPDNVFASFADNGRLLQVVLVALLIGIGLIQIDPERAAPVRGFFEGLNDVIIRLVELIMYVAPLGVFALIASVITDLTKKDPQKALTILGALASYGMVVVIGLALHVGITYLGLLRLFTPFKVGAFLKAMRPVHLLAFSSSSSAATLPVTKKCCEEGLGVDSEITSFTLPLGATINMDGTALYQAVAAVFIAQALGIDLTVGQQLTVLLTAVLASIGTAAVPSAGIIMLVIILQATEPVLVPGIALILAIDRPLDMLRTVVNVTGDVVVTAMVARSENLLHATADGCPLPPGEADIPLPSEKIKEL